MSFLKINKIFFLMLAKKNNETIYLHKSPNCSQIFCDMYIIKRRKLSKIIKILTSLAFGSIINAAFSAVGPHILLRLKSMEAAFLMERANTVVYIKIY